MSRKTNKNKERNPFIDAQTENEDNKNKEDYQKLLPKTKKEMITYKRLQNINLTFYDIIFSNRQFGNTTIENFTSFKTLLEEIKKQFKPELLYDNDISTIKKEGKFCLDKYNLAKIVPFKRKKFKNIEISTNNRYIKIKDIKAKFRNFYINKLIFNRKHIFEINIINLFDTKISFGLVDINNIDEFRKELLDINCNDFNRNNIILTDNIDCFKLESPIFIKKVNNIYHHYLTYGDIIGFGFDLENKLLYLYLNGEIVNTFVLHINLGKNISFIPFISLNIYNEIIFNLGENLKYEDNYKEIGFIPFNKIGANNYEISNLKKVTDDYINILIDNGKSIINNNISFSDINEIYHDIFDFLGNNSFKHSFLIQNSFIKNIEINYENDENFELYYICIRYILNSVKESEKLLKNLILNLTESIHIYLIKGDLSFKKLYNFFIFLLSKNDIVNIISKFDSLSIKKIFSQIFITFHPNEVYFNKINLDFIIKSNQKPKSKNDLIFKDLIIDSFSFAKYLNLAQEFYDNQNICKIFSEFVKIILRNGLESENNENMWDNIIIKNLNDFLKSELSDLRKTHFCLMHGAAKFNNILKSFFIPGMLLFNNLYKDIKKSNNNNLLCYSIIKYLNNDNGEKFGGTIKYLHANYIKKINNYDEIINKKIDSLSSVLFLEFIELFFLNNNSEYLWDFLINMVSSYKDFTSEKFISSIKNGSHDELNSKFLCFLELKLYFPSLEEIKIMIVFLNNFSNILLNELYPSKLIYFLPVKIFSGLGGLIYFLFGLIIFFSDSHPDILDSSNSCQNQKQADRKDLLKLSENCLKQYVSFLSKFISDKCIKNNHLKCIALKLLQTILIKEKYFTDEEIFCIFNFIDEIHNDKEYENNVFNFTKIFNEKLKLSENSFTELGLRLHKLFEQKGDNNNIIRIILNLLYNNINSSLSNLEENFSEFKQSFNNNKVNNLNNSNLEIHNQNSNNGNNISQLADKKKLEKINSSLIDTNWQFIKLNNFYSLSSDIIELYEFDSYENKFLDNLLLLVYDIIFSSDNFGLIKDNKVFESYKKLINTIINFYTIIFKNISLMNKEIIMKELSKRRNIYHLKDIGKCFDKINEIKQEKNINNKIKYFNDFLVDLEKIIPEKEVTKITNDNIDKSFENNKLCLICVDSTVNIHLLPCNHLICRNCYLQCLSGNKLCPFCRITIKGIKEDKND